MIKTPKNKAKTRLIGDRGEGQVKNTFAEHLEWVARKDESDDGFDLNVEIPCDGEHPSERFFVQVKTASVQRKARRDGSWSARIRDPAAIRYINARAPVFLFSVDLSTQEVRWLDLSDALRQKPAQRNFFLSPKQRFNGGSADIFRTAVRRAIKEQDDRHHPPAVALSYRAQRIMEKDPRLDVKIDFIDGQERYSIATKDRAGLPMIAVPATEADHQAMLALYEFGAPAQVTLKSFRFEGYPLLNRESTGGGVFKMDPPAAKTQMEVSITPINGSDTVTIPLAAEIRFGVRGVEMRSADPGCPLEFTLRVDPKDLSDPFTLSFNWKWWVGRPIAKLPWVQKLADFADRLLMQSRISFCTITNGERLLALESTIPPGETAGLQGQADLLRMLCKVSQICDSIKSPAKINGTDFPSPEQQKELMAAWEAINQMPVKCNVPSYVVNPDAELATALRSTSEVPSNFSVGLKLTFGTTPLGVLPLRVYVKRVGVVNNGDGTFTLTPKERGEGVLDPNPPADVPVDEKAAPELK